MRACSSPARATALRAKGYAHGQSPAPDTKIFRVRACSSPARATALRAKGHRQSLPPPRAHASPAHQPRGCAPASQAKRPKGHRRSVGSFRPNGGTLRQFPERTHAVAHTNDCTARARHAAATTSFICQPAAAAVRPNSVGSSEFGPLIRSRPTKSARKENEMAIENHAMTPNPIRTCA